MNQDKKVENAQDVGILKHIVKSFYPTYIYDKVENIPYDLIKEIPTLTGNVILEIKAGTQNGTKLKLKGKGIKTPNSLMRGNMYAIIDVIIPSKLDRKQKSLLEDLAKTELDNSSEFKDFKKYLSK